MTECEEAEQVGLGVTKCEAEQVGLNLAGFIRGAGDGAGGARGVKEGYWHDVPSAAMKTQYLWVSNQCLVTPSRLNWSSPDGVLEALRHHGWSLRCW
ncbi:hypothetical protein EMCRGX_G006330 [Ephydatia muelleri]